MISKRLQGELLLLFITAVWGASFPLMRNVLSLMPFYAYTAIRFTIASITLLIIFRKRLKDINRQLIFAGCMVGILLFGGMYFQVLGLFYTTASNSSFITGLNVIFVPIISAYILRKRPDIHSIIGVGLAFTGLFFLSGGLQLNFNLGDFFTLLCAVCFAFQIITIDKFTHHYDALLIGIVQILSACLLFNLLWIFSGIKPFVLNINAVYILFITGFLGTAVAFVGQTVVQKYTTPTRTALIITMEPVFGAVFASIIPDMSGKTEILTTYSIIGCGLILCGMLAVELPIFKRAKKS